jgi:hypothetical protein
MHFYLNNSVASAGFTSSAFYIETEPAGLITPHTGFSGSGKEFPDICKYTGIRSRIAAGCSSNGRLVNMYHLINILESKDMVMGACLNSGMIKPLGKYIIKGFQNECRFP